MPRGRLTGVLALALATGAAGVLAQPSERERRPSFFFPEASVIAAAGAGMTRVDIHYRIEMGFFIPVRNTDPSVAGEFVCRGEALIELLDSAGTSHARQINQIILGTQSAEQDPERKQWSQGAVSLIVPPGTYTVLIDVSDLESRRQYVEKDRRIFVPDLQRSRVPPSLLLVGENSTRLPDTILVQNFGGSVLFGSPASLMLGLGPGADSAAVSVSYTLSEIRPRSSDSTIVRKGTFRPASAAASLSTPWSDTAGVHYTLSAQGPGLMRRVFLPLQGETLRLRDYSLSAMIRCGGNTTHVTRTFQVLWPDMPQSLRNVDYALDMLMYITTPRELDSLRQGDLESRRDNLERFWAARDRTPGTAFNEVMTEYYRRVDYASRQFSGLNRSDGAKTDRGRIYILNGPPDATQRRLDPSMGYTEVWVYERLRKKFTFIDRVKNGEYVLVSSEPL